MRQEQKKQFKDFIGKGFEYTEHKGDIFTITYSFDYTKIDLDKLKQKILDQIYVMINSVTLEFKEGLPAAIKTIASPKLNSGEEGPFLPFFKIKGRLCMKNTVKNICTPLAAHSFLAACGQSQRRNCG